MVAKLGDLDDDVAVEDAVEIFCDGKKLRPELERGDGARARLAATAGDLRVTFS